MKLNKSILYIYDNVFLELYNDKFYKQTILKQILNNGIILNKEKFEKEYYNFQKKNKIKKVFTKKIIIYDSTISINDLKVLKESFLDLNLKCSKYIKDTSIVKSTKKYTYILGNDKLKILYINAFNSKNQVTLNFNEITNREFLNIIKKFKNIILISSNQKLINLLEKKNNVFIINDAEKYIIKNVKNNLADVLFKD